MIPCRAPSGYEFSGGLLIWAVSLKSDFPEKTMIGNALNTIVQKTPAKINLYLRVNFKRPDGYHDITTVMCPIDLYDILRIDVGVPGGVSCRHPEVPEDTSNLARRAADLFFSKTGISTDAFISIEKHIPVGGGLGGGSSDAAAVLSGLNLHFNNPLSRNDLFKMAGDIGADVPFFLMKKPALAEGIGNKLTPLKYFPFFYLVLILPGIHVSTGDVYKNLNLGLTKCKKPLKYSDFEDFSGVARSLCNDLETVRNGVYPVIEEAKRELLAHGAEGALMSGSGSTIFGLFEKEKKADKARKLISRKAAWKVIKTRVCGTVN